MARESVTQRQKKRERTVARYAKKRAGLMTIIKNASSSDQEKWKARLALQKLPRDSAPTRLRNRCVTGRSNGFYRKFKLARTKFREMAMRGYIPGLVLSSW